MGIKTLQMPDQHPGNPAFIPATLPYQRDHGKGKTQILHPPEIK
jgi:hypothetical protein